MNTAVINIKTDPAIKKQAQKKANEFGLSLSSVINVYLRKFLTTRTVEFSDVRLEPTPYLKRMLKQSEKDIKEGRISPAFSSVEESIAWLDDPRARYQNGDSV
ncbi:type II toxin-antitoxin system RelB/DinJ family antitoxin [Candidatus Gottesmanbacteria bacterium]|nr:type II toxin-antitoxin system RelB/DinJ family antitoxin [Candidatus Gottesmanbacteria bacterium]